MTQKLRERANFIFSMRAAAVMVFSLTACSTLKYQEPISGERARLRVINISDVQVVLKTYEQDNCGGKDQEWMTLQNKFLLNSAPKSLDMPLQDPTWHKNGFKEVFVSAGEINGFMVSAAPYVRRFDGEPSADRFVRTLEYSYPVYAGTIVYYQQVSQMRCGVPFEFDFQANRDYELRYEHKGMSCNITVYEITQNASEAQGWQRVERAKFDNVIKPETQACKDKLNG